jgi:hypothetical protein
VIRIVRRPAFPGEWNHELIWPLVLLAGVATGGGFFYLGLETPGCIFHGLTHLPCLGCGGTRCARALAQLNFWDAFKFHPAFFLAFILATLWTIYSALFWLRRDTLRLRFSINDRARSRLTVIALIFVALHWAWQCYYLSRP